MRRRPSLRRLKTSRWNDLYYCLIQAEDPKALSRELLPCLAERYARLMGRRYEGLRRLPSGKPIFASENGLHLSVSHSRTHWAVVFGTVPLGADLEARDCCRPRVAARYFTEEEREMPFATVWTGREAVGKLTGGGLTHALRCEISHGVGHLDGESYSLVHILHQDQLLTLALPPIPSQEEPKEEEKPVSVEG